jgi:hypothetical protein
MWNFKDAVGDKEYRQEVVVLRTAQLEIFCETRNLYIPDIPTEQWVSFGQLFYGGTLSLVQICKEIEDDKLVPL